MPRINFRVGNTWIDIVDIIYPVGSVYLSYNNTSPNQIFPNQKNIIRNWTEITGKYLYTGGNGVAGTSDFKITSSMLPKHTHGIGGSTGAPNRTSTVGPSPATTEDETSHTHGVGTYYTESGGGHNHQMKRFDNSAATGTARVTGPYDQGNTSATTQINTSWANAHSHTIKGTSGPGSKHNHGLNSHTHGLNSHTHTLPANTSDGGFANNVYKPYYQALYCWYRIEDTILS